MKTIAEIRRENLQALITQHGSVAQLNERLGWVRTDPRLTRIRNAQTRGDRPGKSFAMGDAMAREIEKALSLENGWMDNVHQRAPATAAVCAEEDRPYGTTPAATPATQPPSGRDWRTVAYTLAASLERNKRQVDVATFLAMVDAAVDVITSTEKTH
jgi:hypothetical protein